MLGTFVEITADTAAAIDAGFEAIARVHQLMSAHEPDSDLSRINRFAHRQAVEVSDWTALVLERALHWSRESRGAFDIVRAGKTAIERRLLPRHPDQPRPEASHWTGIEMQGRQVRVLRPACLDLGGIAKGFAVDRAIDALRAAGSRQGLVNAGGDLACFGKNPWRAEIVHPATRQPAIEVHLSDQALATSALLPTDSGGLSGEHLVDCGEHWISVSVQAWRCMDADALTKILLADAPVSAHCLEAARAKVLRMDRDGTVEAVEPEAVAA